MHTTFTATRPSLTRRWQNPLLAKLANQDHSKLLQAAAEKIATLGGDQELAFEQSFASLAYTYLKDKAPKLLNYLIGFQLVDRNDDNTKAIGIFGFRLQNSWVYAPFFFLNGDLKGHEMMYLKEQDLFVPLKENWVNYLLSSKQQILGEPQQGSLREMGVRQPDIRSLRFPPNFGKFGSDSMLYPNVAIGGWLPPSDGFKHVYAALTNGNFESSAEHSLTKYAGFKAEQSLEAFVRQSPSWCKLAMDLCDRYPTIGEALTRFHGRDFFKSALLDMQNRTKKSALLEDRLSKDVYDYHFTGQRKKKKNVSLLGEKKSEPIAVEVLVRDTLLDGKTASLSQLSEAEAATLAREGYLVRDRRPLEKMSQAYETQVTTKLVNPDDTGIYQVLQRPATFVKALVIHHPHGSHDRAVNSVVVRLDPKDYVNAHQTRVFAKPDESTREDFENWYDSLPDISSPERGKTYVMISRHGDGTVPFEIQYDGDLGDGRYAIRERDYPCVERRTDPPRGHYEMPSYERDSPCRSLLYLEDRTGSRFHSYQGILRVPEKAKLLVVSNEKPDSYSPTNLDEIPPSEEDKFYPGDWKDLDRELQEKTSSLKIYADTSEVSINNGLRLSKLAGLKSLILDYGFEQREAMDMMRIAETAQLTGHTGRFRAIYGPGYPIEKSAAPLRVGDGYGPSAPAIEDPDFGYSQEYGGVSTQEPQEYSQEVEELSSYNTDPEIYNPLPENQTDPMAAQQTQQAASSGQKEIFDTAMITGLLKSVRQDSLVQRYVPDLIKAMDRTGRLLFLSYWHNDEFSDRYSKSDMPELEDSLRNSFEAIGDLSLFLKERDVTPLTGGGPGADLDVDDATGD